MRNSIIISRVLLLASVLTAWGNIANAEGKRPTIHDVVDFCYVMDLGGGYTDLKGDIPSNNLKLVCEADGYFNFAPILEDCKAHVFLSPIKDIVTGSGDYLGGLECDWGWDVLYNAVKSAAEDMILTPSSEHSHAFVLTW